ncbi:geranylgeranylglyceryl/heptaprenylglyceryl phosphate synthase [Lacinutrix iliipiscaria]|uniref:Geranylgeranylglyceryl phosphate synthase n=1 Tax=Lacinutrix iliipiscaria TaxID=1230532 RepID=A0ABW5WJF7_9FLAO
MNILNDILNSVKEKQKLLAVLIDPDKMKLESLPDFMQKLNASIATHIFVGGSTVKDKATERLVVEIKALTELPVVIFPGDVSQITAYAHAILFLSLISGRNADYLIGKHVASVSKLRATNLEVIPTGYILVENGKETAVQKVTGTQPMSYTNPKQIIDTAKAGELLGLKLMYLEAGSGAILPVSTEIIKRTKATLSIPLIVGGGIRTKEQLDKAYQSGADLVVIGTAFEEDKAFFNELKKETH